MGSSAQRGMVGEQPTQTAVYRTIQASNTARNNSPVYTTEELEELEARGINPYFDKTINYIQIVSTFYMFNSDSR